MIRLEIDGKPVEVPPGETVLAAARRLGITIPALCFLEGLEPFASCMVCLVKNEATGRLVPSCVAPAEEGMRITTGDEEVLKARRSALELLLGDHAGDCEAPCHRACPARIDVARLARCLAKRDFDGAVKVLRETVGSGEDPCAECDARCEKACRKLKLDASASLKMLVAWVQEYAGRSGADSEKTGTSAPNFRVTLGGLKEKELKGLAEAVSSAPRIEPKTEADVVAEASRCLCCDCNKALTCKLRLYADLHAVRQKRYAMGERRELVRVRQHAGVIFEPAKCIKCGICVRIAERGKEPLGLSFIGRGFDVRIGVPFDEDFSKALTTTAEECVKGCPTGALSLGT